MPRKHLPKIAVAGSPIVLSPVFEHYGDLKGPGDLFVGWHTTSSPCEEDRDLALQICRGLEGSFTSIGAAKAALSVAQRRIEAEAKKNA